MRYRVFIDGGHGTTGLEIRERLEGRDDIQIIDIEEKYRKDLAARVEMTKRADVTVMCLPDGASRELAEVLPDDVRVIDTSTAHRVDPGWVYGMPELEPGMRDKIRNASRVANPGCHATGFILLARPLVDAGLISSKSPLSSFCITGFSGGGKKMIEDYGKRHKELLEREGVTTGNDRTTALSKGPGGLAVSPAQYALGQAHKHLPEMKVMSGLSKEPVFCPVVGDFYRGMVMTIELPGELILGGGSSEDTGSRMERIREAYMDRYSEEPLISIKDGTEDAFLYSDSMAGSDGFQIMVLGNDDRILLVSRFDNLGKGASGAAVQNLNIMLGTDELTGLSVQM